MLNNFNKTAQQLMYDAGFTFDSQIGAYVKKITHANGNNGCITVDDSQVSYVLRNKNKQIIRGGATKEIKFSNNNELRAAVRSACTTMDFELDENW